MVADPRGRRCDPDDVRPSWTADADALVADYERLSAIHAPCRKPRDPRENLAILVVATRSQLADTLGEGGLRWTRSVVANIVAKRAEPGSLLLAGAAGRPVPDRADTVSRRSRASRPRMPRSAAGAHSCCSTSPRRSGSPSCLGGGDRGLQMRPPLLRRPARRAPGRRARPRHVPRHHPAETPSSGSSASSSPWPGWTSPW